MQWGEHRELLASLEEQPVVPQLEVWDDQVWRAWCDLGTERPFIVSGYSVPMGGTVIQSRPGPIPWSKMQEWCDRAGCNSEDRDYIVPLIVAIDQEYIAHCNAKQAAQMAPQTLDDKLARWDAANDG